jgi:hypothetical protein
VTTLELNIKAKKHTLQPPVAAAPPNTGPIKLEEGKKYILNNGNVTDSMITVPPYYRCIVGDYTEQGMYSGMQKDPNYPLHVAREWFPTWKEHDLWIAGGQIERLRPDGTWRKCAHSYASICDAFGKDSLTTKEWWHTNYAALFNVPGTHRMIKK